MAECDRHPKYRDVSSSGSFESIQEKIIQDELIWGLSYRQLKRKEKEVPIPPKKSPMDIPFKICREKQRRRKQKKRKVPQKSTPTEKKPQAEKLSLLERSVLTQNQYMNYLAVPNVKEPVTPTTKKKCRCYIEPCPPRVVQLAVPKKRRVFANWRDYYHFLPTVMIMRFEQILHTDKNLEPREARYYYRKLDQQRKKKMRAKRRQRKKKEAEKEKGDQAWLDEQIKLTVKVIMDFFMEEPLFTLNYKQLMLSDGILERLDESKILKKPSRGSKSQFKRSIVEFSDKIAVWMDTLTRFVDIQAIDGDEDIPPLTMSSLESEGEEEESESSYYSELEKDLWDEYGGEGEGEFGFDMLSTFLMGSLLGKGDEGEEGEDLDGLFGDMDLDLLEKLIRILSNCSDEYLQGEVNPDRMPGIRYIDILDRVKELRDGILKKGPQKPFLEMVMLDWAIKNEPDEIDDKMRNKIHETAALLGDFLFGAGGRKELGAEDMYGAGMYEEEGEGGEIIEEEFLKGVAGGELQAGIGAGGVGVIDEIEIIEGIEGTEGIEGIEITEGTEGMEELGGWGEGGEDDLSDEERRRREEEERRRLEEEERRRREMDRLAALEAEGGDTITALDLSLETVADEGEGYDMELAELGELGEEFEGEVSILFGPALEGRIIKGHKPAVILEHRPDMVCCLSLKTWAVWLLEITHNAHNWTKWVHCIILQIKEFASIVRGEVKLPNGQTKLLYKAEWRKFAEETTQKLALWKNYSKHVKELSNSIIENYHGKKVLNCCPKCLQDHLITNVVKAHETLAALTEAMNNAEYWQKCLDEIVQKTCRLADLEQIEKEAVSSSESESDSEKSGEESEESVYEIEEVDLGQSSQGRGGRVCTPRQAGPMPEFGQGPSGPWGRSQGPPGPWKRGQGPPGPQRRGLGTPGSSDAPSPWQRSTGGPRPGGPPEQWQGGAGPSQGRGRGCHSRRF